MKTEAYEVLEMRCVESPIPKETFYMMLFVYGQELFWGAPNPKLELWTISFVCDCKKVE
jgi:hypothetical protein